MPYKHFGNHADVWKHIALCDVLGRESPSVYIETNSASTTYRLNNSPEQTFGIYHFIGKASRVPRLHNTPYFAIEHAALKNNQYIGSPGLAMLLLKGTTVRFVFFDIEKAPLDDIRDFAKSHQLETKTETHHEDSLNGLADILPGTPHNTFIHIDPYFIDKPGPDGHDYMDLFVNASQQGKICFLWYGFHTLSEKKRINGFIRDKLTKGSIGHYLGVELILEMIRPNTIICNPGILGSGLLTCNLSDASNSAIIDYSDLLIELYKGSAFEGFCGDMYREFL